MARVPQFGDWENAGKVPYTACFDNARAGRGGGKLFNPNDPQDNPDAFSGGRGRGNDTDNSSPANMPGNGFLSSERKVHAQGSQYRPTPSPTRSNYMPPAAINATPEKVRALPKFGEWDDPSAASSGGYTVIFNEVREGKQVGNAKIPVTDTQNHYTGHGKRHDEYTNPSCFGCLFRR